MKRAVIYFKSGSNDFVDPIDDESDIWYGDTVIIITNGANCKYVYDKTTVDRVELIELSEEQK